MGNAVAVNGTRLSAWVAPVMAAVTLFGGAFVFGGRISALESASAADARRIEALESEAKVVRDYMRSIDNRLSRIEGKLDAIGSNR